MAADIEERFEVIEECYEFMLAYAAQGLASDKGSESGRQIREFLHRAVNALIGLPAGCAEAMGAAGRHSWPCWSAMRAIRWRHGARAGPACDQFAVDRQPERLGASARAAHGRVSAWRGLAGEAGSGKVGDFLVRESDMTFDAMRRQFLEVVTGASVLAGVSWFAKGAESMGEFPAAGSATQRKWSR
jgi:hypothetical protein